MPLAFVVAPPQPLSWPTPLSPIDSGAPSSQRNSCCCGHGTDTGPGSPRLDDALCASSGPTPPHANPWFGTVQLWPDGYASLLGQALCPRPRCTTTPSQCSILFPTPGGLLPGGAPRLQVWGRSPHAGLAHGVFTRVAATTDAMVTHVRWLLGSGIPHQQLQHETLATKIGVVVGPLRSYCSNQNQIDDGMLSPFVYKRVLNDRSMLYL